MQIWSLAFCRERWKTGRSGVLRRDAARFHESTSFLGLSYPKLLESARGEIQPGEFLGSETLFNLARAICFSVGNSSDLATPQEQRCTAARPRFDLRTRRQRQAAEDRGTPRRGSEHAEQHAGGLVDVVERDQPTLLLHPQPIRQGCGSGLNSVGMEHSADIGKPPRLLQHHALKHDHFLVKRKIRTGYQRRT